MRRSGWRWRVVKFDKPELLRFDDCIQVEDPRWLMPAFWLAVTGVAACLSWVVVEIAERAAGR